MAEFNIDNKNPRPVRCIKAGGTVWGGCSGANLEVGKIYHMTHSKVYGWHTEVFLEEVNSPGEAVGVGFDSCLFEEVGEIDKPEIKIVIGANFGDEGKGLMTDTFASQYENCLVVRCNGGSQAGHTVITPEGNRHVFKHFGSGTLAGAHTLLSQDFIINPIVFRTEREELVSQFGIAPVVYADDRAIITTPFDMLLNQAKEAKRGDDRHGSCGNGIFETIQRCKTQYATTLKAVRTKKRVELRMMLTNIRDEYFMAQIRQNGLADVDGIMDIALNDNLIDRYVDDLIYFGDYVFKCVPPMRRYDGIVFEGAQGLLLSQNNQAYFPNLTPSDTGLKNPIKFIKEFLPEHTGEIEVVYVTRTYMTRHGAGRFESECKPDMLSESPIVDETNMPNQYQGSLRYGYFDYRLFENTVETDFNCSTENMKLCIAITHTNETDGKLILGEDSSIDVKQYIPFKGKLHKIYLSDGMTRDSVSYISDRKELDY